METQIGQLANFISNRQQGTLPSNTEKNPKEQVQAITLRSGKELVGPSQKAKEEQEETTSYHDKDVDKSLNEKQEKKEDISDIFDDLYIE